MTREQAMELIKRYVQNKNLINHMVATEAVMGALAEHFGEDKEQWALAGLLHDIDYDQTASDPMRHGLVGAEILEQQGVDPSIIYAVKVHTIRHGLPRLSKMDKALHACDPLTGLIVASALIHPTKQLASIDGAAVLRRFGEKHFARGAKREQIQRCSELGMELEEFITIGLQAMQAKHNELGL